MAPPSSGMFSSPATSMRIPSPRKTPLNAVTIPRYSGSAIARLLEPGGKGPDQHPAAPGADHPDRPVVRGRPAAHPRGEPDDVDQNAHAEPGGPRGLHIPAFLLRLRDGLGCGLGYRGGGGSGGVEGTGGTDGG